MPKPPERAPGRGGLPRQSFLTTAQVADLLGVSLPTVVNWVKAGRLSAHRTPGGHRRIAPEEILRFCDEHEYPLPPSLGRRHDGPLRLLIVDRERDFSEMVNDYLAMQPDIEVWVAEDAFQAGMLVCRHRPDMLLLDMHMAGLDAAQVRRVLQAEQGGGDALVILGTTALLSGQVRARARAGRVDELLEKPIALERLLREVRSASGRDR